MIIMMMMSTSLLGYVVSATPGAESKPTAGYSSFCFGFFVWRQARCYSQQGVDWIVFSQGAYYYIRLAKDLQNNMSFQQTSNGGGAAATGRGCCTNK